jgi:hypothetical protein
VTRERDRQKEALHEDYRTTADRGWGSPDLVDRVQEVNGASPWAGDGDGPPLAEEPGWPGKPERSWERVVLGVLAVALGAWAVYEGARCVTTGLVALKEELT